MTQSRRVWPTISMIVGTPRPGSPTSRAQAPCSSISLEALERLPSLSFRRWRWKALRVPSGRIRGSAKQPMPSSVWASTRNRSHIGAEQNHLCPVSSYSSPGPPAPPPSGRATVVLARTSEPPCFSVIAMPHSALALPAAQLGVVGRRGQPRLPLGGELGLRAQRRHRGERHRDRAGEAALGLCRGEVQRGARGVRGGLRRRPRQRVQLVTHRERHEVVPCAMELDLVDALAVAVEGLQLRRVLVGLEAPAGSAPRPTPRRPHARAPAPSRRPRARAPRRAAGCRRTGCGPPAAGPGWRPRGCETGRRARAARGPCPQVNHPWLTGGVGLQDRQRRGQRRARAA